jgi:hypothetical protein
MTAAAAMAATSCVGMMIPRGPCTVFERNFLGSSALTIGARMSPASKRRQCPNQR